MNNNITLFVASDSGAPIRKIVVSKFMLMTMLFIGIGIAVGLGLVFYDYYHLTYKRFNASKLNKKLSVQNHEIADQRKQIQMFAIEINAIKKKLVDLNSFEQKIRIIANIENSPEEQNGVFGVGGSIPEDLDISMMLTQKHNSLLREMHQQVNELEEISVNQHESFESLLKGLDEKRNLLASTPAISPTKGWITSRFGYRKSPFTGLREFHKGLDIAARKGTPVIATADGIITYHGKKGLLGNTLIVNHGHGMVTRYAHLNKILKKRGDAIKRGDHIGEVGNTGRSTGPHLHYDVRLNGISVNPEKYILN